MGVKWGEHWWNSIASAKVEYASCGNHKRSFILGGVRVCYSLCGHERVKIICLVACSDLSRAFFALQLGKCIEELDVSA